MVRPTTYRATSTWPLKRSRSSDCRPRPLARWPRRRPADGAAVARDDARGDTPARRPRTTAVFCCTLPPSATRRNRHRPRVDGDGGGASMTAVAAAEAPQVFRDADDGGDGPVADVDVAAVVVDGDGGDADGNLRRRLQADDHTPSTNQPRRPVEVQMGIRHRWA